MRVETIPLLSDNYAYLIVCEETKKAAVVDPGDVDPVRAAVLQHGAQLVAVFCTHHHGDHVGGVETLARGGDLAIYGHESDRRRIPKLTHSLRDGDVIKLGELEIQVIHVPGHTRGGLVYCAQDAAFTGDTLFVAGCGRLFEGTAEVLFDSLHGRLLPALGSGTKIYCGHNYAAKNLAFAQVVDPENDRICERIDAVSRCDVSGEPTVPATLEDELSTNPFLRVRDSDICGFLGERFRQDNFEDPVRVFARLRQLRDQF